MARASFSFDRSQRKGRQRLFFATLFVVSLLLVDIVSGGKLRSLAHTAGSGIWTLTSSTRSAIFGNGYFVSHASLAAENAALREEIAHYQESIAQETLLQQENEELRGIVHLAGGKQGITAPVVSSVFSSPYGTFLVGAGKDSVVSGALVLSSGGFVLGTIRTVETNRSLVAEIFAPSAKVNLVIGKSAVQAEGRGSGNARAVVPREVNVHKGDVVLAPEYGNRPVAVVGKIQSAPSDAGQTLYLSVPIDISSLHFIYIVQ